MVLTRFVAMTGIVLIGYLFNFTKIKSALFVRICLARLHGLAHTRGARGQGVAVIVIISDDDDSHNSIRGLEGYLCTTNFETLFNFYYIFSGKHYFYRHGSTGSLILTPTS